MNAKWLSAKATRYAHPDKQISVVFSRPKEQDTFEVLLSGPEAESAIRQLMQACANSIGKALTFCVYPEYAGEMRLPVVKQVDAWQRPSKELVPTLEQLHEYAYAIKLWPRNKPVPIQMLDVLRMQVKAAWGLRSAEPPSDAPRPIWSEALQDDIYYASEIDPYINRLRATDEPPAARGKFDVFKVCGAYESGFGQGEKGNGLPNPYIDGSPEFEAYQIGVDAGYAEGKRGASPPPPAEQPFAWVRDDRPEGVPLISFRADRPTVPGSDAWFPLYRAAQPPTECRARTPCDGLVEVAETDVHVILQCPRCGGCVNVQKARIHTLTKESTPCTCGVATGWPHDATCPQREPSDETSGEQS